MKRLWRDTLFKRLFILMWVALVVSHLAAWSLVTRWMMPPGADKPPASPGPARNIARMLPSLPPMPSLPPTPGLRGHGPPPPDEHGDGPSLPAGALLFDYGVRFVIIGIAAWWGARWLSAPMRRLVDASQALATSVGGDAPLPALPEDRGTVEVRETAQVFNAMAQQLDTQFRNRSLLAAAISHDLRTPLTRMRMRLESLAHEPAAARCIADVREMNELIDSALQTFRGDASGEAPRATDVLSLVQALGDDLLDQGQPVSVSGMHAIVPAQPAALRRALANLVGNALRYGERADVQVRQDDCGVTIIVDDDGPGIPAGQLEAVFAPYYRVEGSRHRGTGGTGLGLYIARDLVQRQGGRLTLANRPRGGLRATVMLPLR